MTTNPTPAEQPNDREPYIHMDPRVVYEHVPAPPPLQDNQRLGEYYGQPRYAAPAQPTNGLAVAALVLGIVWAFWIGSVLAIVFGHVALGQIRQRNQSGKGMAVAGLVLGYVGAGTFALFVVLPLLLGAGA
jgi:hypothetical protein